MTIIENIYFLIFLIKKETINYYLNILQNQNENLIYYKNKIKKKNFIELAEKLYINIYYRIHINN